MPDVLQPCRHCRDQGADPSSARMDGRDQGRIQSGAIKSVAKLTWREATRLPEAIASRITGRSPTTETYSPKIRKAAEAIEEWLGGTPDLFKLNKNGDMIVMKGDKKVRFDIYKPGKKELGQPNEPHFHLEESDGFGGWRNAGENHWNYFKSE